MAGRKPAQLLRLYLHWLESVYGPLAQQGLFSTLNQMAQFTCELSKDVKAAKTLLASSPVRPQMALSQATVGQ